MLESIYIVPLIAGIADNFVYCPVVYKIFLNRSMLRRTLRQITGRVLHRVGFATDVRARSVQMPEYALRHTRNTSNNRPTYPRGCIERHRLLTFEKVKISSSADENSNPTYPTSLTKTGTCTCIINNVCDYSRDCACGRSTLQYVLGWWKAVVEQCPSHVS